MILHLILKKYYEKPWSENKQQASYFKKIVMHINKFWKQSFVGFSKNIQFIIIISNFYAG